jgi:prepilin-type N-terminal cleavage/methylation domain-containing protein
MRPSLHDILPVMQRPSCRHTGFSLVELALALTLIATIFAIALPAFGHARAVLSVRAARAELMSAIATTRAQAILVGGAHIIISPAGTMHTERADGVPIGDATDLAARYGVTIETARSAPVVLRYDALGIGRLTNTTITVRRATVSADVIVSAYGRART